MSFIEAILGFFVEDGYSVIPEFSEAGLTLVSELFAAAFFCYQFLSGC